MPQTARLDMPSSWVSLVNNLVQGVSSLPIFKLIKRTYLRNIWTRLLMLDVLQERKPGKKKKGRKKFASLALDWTAAYRWKLQSRVDASQDMQYYRLLKSSFAIISRISIAP